MLNAMYSIQDNLETIKTAERGVILHLRGGQDLAGKLGGWSDKFLVLTHVIGEDAHEAVVRIDDIAALSVSAH